MNFNDKKVRQRMMEHIGFAVSSVTAAIPDQITDVMSSGDKTMIDMTNALRHPIIMEVLRFTLSLDGRLKNSLNYDKTSILADGKTLPLDALLEE